MLLPHDHHRTVSRPLASSPGIAAACVLGLCATAAWGQIATDGSVGTAAAGPLTGPDYQIPASLGQTTGNNLFHSFSQFNVNTGESATFTGPTHIANVLARVTGGSASNIDGLLRSSGMPNANFFLMNPNGVVFGPNAQLDVGGSFVVTTANQLHLADGGSFTASTDASQSVLTTAPPAAFGFLSPQAGPVTAQGSQLTAALDRGVSIVAGDVQMDAVQLQAPGGRVDIASVASPGSLGLDVQDLDSPIDTSAFSELGDVTIANGSTIAADGPQGGRVTVQAKDITLETSTLTSRTLGPGAGRPVQINATGDLSVVSATVLTETTSQGRGGDVNLSATNVLIDGAAVGAFVGSNTLGQGDGGHVSVDSQTTTLLNGAAIGTATFTQAAGGPIVIESQDLLIDGQGFIPADPLIPRTGVVSVAAGPGPGGAISIQAPTLTLLEGAAVTATSTGQGAGAAVTVVSDSILIDSKNFSSPPSPAPDPQAVTGILSFTVGLGSSGPITLDVSQVLDVIGTVSLSSVWSLTLGDQPAGSVTVNAGQVRVQGRGTIASQTLGLGSGGDVAITADHVLVSGADAANVVPFFEIDASVLEPFGVFPPPALLAMTSSLAATTLGPGDAGDLTIQAQTVEVLDSALLLTNSMGPGHAGDLTVSSETLTVGQGQSDFLSGLFSTASEFGGDAGDISISSNTVDVSAGAIIAADTTGPGRGGSVTISGDHVSIIGNEAGAFTLVASQTVDPVSGGEGGNLTIDASQELTIKFAGVSTSTFGPAKGGDIALTAPQITIEEGRDGGVTTVTATTFGSGKGGQIRLDANEIDIVGPAALVASASFSAGDAGRVEVTAQSLTIDGKDVEFDIGNFFLITGIGAEAFGDDSVGGLGGEIFVDVEDLTLVGGGVISAVATGLGVGGDIIVEADRLVADSGGAINSTSTGSGDAGRIDLEVLESVSVTNAASIASVSQGSGVGGNIELKTSFLLLDNRGAITASTAGTGDGGLVKVTTDSLEVRDGSIISADNFSSQGAKAGNLVIETTSLVMAGLEGAQDPFGDDLTGLITRAGPESGRGGDISIKADSIELSHEAAIDATTSGPGRAGNITLSGRTDTTSLQLDLKSGSVISSSTLSSQEDSGGDGGGGSGTGSGSGGGGGGSGTGSGSGDGGGGSGTGSGSGDGGGGSGTGSGSGDGGGGSGTGSGSGDGGGGSGTGSGSGDGGGGSGSGSGSGDGGGGSGTGSGSGDGGGGSGSGSGSGDGGGGSGSGSGSGDGDGGGGGDGDGNSSKAGNAGNVTIDGQRISVVEGSRIESTTDTTGDGGTIVITVTGEVLVAGLDLDDDNRSSVQAKARSDQPGAGDAGVIEITARDITVLDGAQVDSGTIGPGMGNDLVLTAMDMITVMGVGTRVVSDTRGTGHGGDINMNAAQVAIRDGAVVTAVTSSTGNAGKITLDVLGSLNLESGGLISTTTSGLGTGGTIDITADEVFLDGLRSRILANTSPTRADMAIILDITHPFDQDLTLRLFTPSETRSALIREEGGDGDNFINTRIDDRADQPFSAGTAPFTGTFLPREPLGRLVDEAASGTWTLDVRDRNAGNSGSLDAWSLVLGDQVFTATDLPQAIPDNGTLQSSVQVDLGPSARVQGAGGDTGPGGSVTINTQVLELRNAAQISAASVTSGLAGDVEIHSQGSVVFKSGASVTTSALESDGGNITITAGTTIDVLASTISAEAGGDGGNIKLTAPQHVQLVDSTLTAEAGGDGAKIEIDPVFVILRNSVINGLAGGQDVEVIIDPNAIFLSSGSVILTDTVSLPPELDLSGSLVVPPVSLLDALARLQAQCAVQVGAGASSFTESGPGGTTVTPDGWLPSVDLAVPGGGGYGYGTGPDAAESSP